MRNGSNKGSKVRPYTDLWVSDGCWPLNPCFPHLQTFYAWQTIYFWTFVAIHLIWAYFHRNQTILKIWPPYKRSMTFSYFVLYLDNATLYGYHVIYFFIPYNKRNNMTRITTKLKHFEFSNAWRGVSLSSLEGGLYNTFHTILLEFHNQCITVNLSR